MMHRLLLLILLLCAAGCANIVPPAGGTKDTTPPKLVAVSPADSQTNVRTGRVRFDFDEYITLSDAASQVLISPIIPVQPVVTSLYKRVTITFPDSLLEDNTTYHISLGNAVRDNHEGNIYKGHDFIFSTGAYFDSLKLSGRVVNAATGLPDSSATILLYNVRDGDSALLRRKPFYAQHTDAGGNFTFSGLPRRTFNIYALQDKNTNLLFDAQDEWIGFTDRRVTPGADTLPVLLRTFPPRQDTLRTAAAPAVTSVTAAAGRFGRRPATAGITGYLVIADTTDSRRRTQDINRPLAIDFSRLPQAINRDKIFLSADSVGITVEEPVTLHFDSSGKRLELHTPWQENTVYTLRLQKGFAKDSGGTDLLPGRFTFRTRRDEDYAKLRVHLPGRYVGKGYLLQVSTDADTIYLQPVLDSNVSLLHLSPGNYRLHVIEDRNGNGHWDTGDLFGRLQPETVTPYDQVILLKPGWENEVDFERAPAPARQPAGKTPAALLK